LLDLNAALKRYDDLAQKGREALQWEIENRNSGKICWFDTDEFIADLEHFLNEALTPDKKTYLYGEDTATGRKVEIKEI